MPRRLVPALAALLLAACGGDSSGSTTPEEPLLELRAEQVAGSLNSATYAIAPPGDARLFVVEQRGVVRILRGTQFATTPFIDISARVSQAPEDGLLSMAFDPAFATNGRAYLYFVNSAGDIEIDRVVASGDVADPSTATTVITIPHPASQIHNGGMVTFGPDGMMYLATGDGQYTDPPNNAQNLGSLLGKVLRLDVSSLPYAIPADNPFVAQSGARGEIWALGLRNPWRFAIDAAPGDTARIWIADVGHEAWEEVNVVPLATPGVNYGWKIMEADHCWPASTTSCNTAGLQRPVHEYSHNAGCAVTGGFVYRGSAIPALTGKFLFSDYCGGGLSAIRRDATGAWNVQLIKFTALTAVRSFGRDGAGELYIVTPNTLYRIATP